MSTTCHKHEHRHVITFNILNNITTFGVLHIPAQVSPPYPLVITLHGLASSKIGSKRLHVRLAEKLSKCSIAVLRVDFPGHGDAEGDPYDFSFSDYVLSANEIISHGYGLNHIDTKNIAVFGSSLGATLSLLNMSTLHYVKSLAVWAPTIQGAVWLQEAVHLPNNLITHSPSSEDIFYGGMRINKTFCSQFIDMDVTKEIPRFSDSLSILYMQGEDDNVVSLHHQKIFSEAISHKPNPYEIRVYPHTGHHIPQSCSMLSELVQWLKHQLIP